MEKILVTGATGTNGKALAAQLRSRQADFVVGSRNVTQARELFGDGVEVRAFDFGDATTYDGALEGVGKVFVLGPPLDLQLYELVSPFLDHLKKRGIARVVYFSALQADKMGSQLDFHTKIEQQLKEGFFDYTILQPSFFSQNFRNYEGENILERNIVFMPAGMGKVGFVDVADIANVAAEVLLSDGHSHATYRLTGPELLSYEDAARLLSEQLGKTISYPNPTPETFKEVLAASGAPAFIGQYLSDVYQIIAQHHVDFLTDDVFRVTGKQPTSLREVIARDFA
ncbi:MAG TPA: SDR family oxidoreductase [Flavobacterium sp.]|nr:SDR family oxidoreductase [Flavobacterium sp.]